MRTKPIVFIIISILAVSALLIGAAVSASMQKKNNPSETPGTPPEVSVIPVTDEPDKTPDIHVPTVIDPATPDTVEPTETPFDPNDPYGNGDIADDELPDDPGVVVVTVEIEDVKPADPTVPNMPTDPTAAPDPEPEIDPRPTPTPIPDPPEDQVTQEVKKPDVKPDPGIMPDVINDEITEKKEEAEEESRKEEDNKPEMVVEETKIPVEEEDKDVKANDESDDAKPEENGGNGPVFVNPAKGGAIPFENYEDAEIEEHDSEEYVDDGGDKPGEGIHF